MRNEKEMEMRKYKNLISFQLAIVLVIAAFVSIVAITKASARPELTTTMDDLDRSLGQIIGPQASIAAYDPNRPATPPLDVAKEGHWFPNQDYSRIRYDINLYDTSLGLPVWYSYYIHIDKGDDPYA